MSDSNPITGSFTVSLNFGSQTLDLKSNGLTSSTDKPLTFQLKEGTAPQVSTAELVNWISANLQDLGLTALPDELSAAAPNVTIDKLLVSTDKTFNLEAKFEFEKDQAGKPKGWEIVHGFSLNNVTIQVGNRS